VGGDLTFVGGSAIIDPLGKILDHGGEEETLLLVDIDPAMVAEVRTTMPFLKDRKPHLLRKTVDSSQ
jgi:predicted amidohydrolase